VKEIDITSFFYLSGGSEKKKFNGNFLMTYPVLKNPADLIEIRVVR
jgi:hypothetical protein